MDGSGNLLRTEMKPNRELTDFSQFRLVLLVKASQILEAARKSK